MLPAGSDNIHELSPDSEAAKAMPAPEPSTDELRPGSQYVTGAKLVVIVAAVSMASFLMLLDTMIVSTVRQAAAFRYARLCSVR